MRSPCFIGPEQTVQMSPNRRRDSERAAAAMAAHIQILATYRGQVPRVFDAAGAGTKSIRSHGRTPHVHIAGPQAP